MDISHDWHTVITRHGNDIEKAHDKIRIVEASLEIVKGKYADLEAKASEESSIDFIKQLIAQQHDLLQHNSREANDNFAENLALLKEIHKKQTADLTALSHRVTVLFGLLLIMSVLNLIAARFL